ncbi:MAG: NAD(P)(+) transhydrogenase (Re/Si-specific) subunit beta [Pseudohongiellaceae bacterium]
MRRENRPVGVLIVLTFALSAIAGAQESPNQAWANYDESADLARLAELDNARMHYRLLRSGMQTPGSLWASLNDEINGLTPARYRALEPLVVESSVAELQAMVRAGDLSYEELTLFYLSRIREIEGDPSRYLNAVISLNPASVERARALDLARRAAPDVERDPIYGMPILHVDHSDQVFFIKRSMGKGYAGVQNELFFNDNTTMLFGDAKESIGTVVSEFKD